MPASADPSVNIRGITDLAVADPLYAGEPAGVFVTFRTMGTHCGSLLANSSSLYSDSYSFTYKSRLNRTSGEAVHMFMCSSCKIDALSSLSATFHPTCQSFFITCGAVGAGGGVSAASVYVTAKTSELEAGAAMRSVEAAFAISLEVVQDKVRGARNDVLQTPLITGGRSVAGYVVTTASFSVLSRPLLLQSMQSTKVTVSLALQAAYTRFDLNPVQTLTALFGSLVGFLNLIGAGAIVLFLHTIRSKDDRRPPSTSEVKAETAETSLAEDTPSSVSAASTAVPDKSSDDSAFAISNPLRAKKPVAQGTAPAP